MITKQGIIKITSIISQESNTRLSVQVSVERTKQKLNQVIERKWSCESSYDSTLNVLSCILLS